jgi:protein-tyrosine phosphatase
LFLVLLIHETLRDSPVENLDRFYNRGTEQSSFKTRATQEIVQTVLFLCTGNYYRSRFAEELFNHRAARDGLSWMAQSRAPAIERGIDNGGAISPFARKALEERGLVAQGEHRLPLQCNVIDLQTASHIVALNEVEHRPLMLERFPCWEESRRLLDNQ